MIRWVLRSGSLVPFSIDRRYRRRTARASSDRGSGRFRRGVPEAQEPRPLRGLPLRDANGWVLGIGESWILRLWRRMLSITRTIAISIFITRNHKKKGFPLCSCVF